MCGFGCIGEVFVISGKSIIILFHGLCVFVCREILFLINPNSLGAFCCYFVGYLVVVGVRGSAAAQIQ